MFKTFPFNSKYYTVSFLAKHCSRESHALITILIQVIFGAWLVFFFEKVYRYRSLYKFKSQPQKKWLFLDNPTKYELLRAETFREYFTKIVPSVLIAVFLIYVYGKSPRVNDKFPTVWEMFYQINESMLITDVLFYLVHHFACLF